MASPFISVVIPTYNASKFLREALDSLLAQTFTDWEAICVNDGSTDDSLSIMQEYAAKDSRFRILDGPNGGYGKAMNRGMDAARGKYMAILEPDDYLPAFAYEHMAAAAQEHHCDIVRGGCCHFYETESGREHHYQALSFPSGLVLRPQETPTGYLRAASIWTGLYNCTFLKENGIRFHESPGAAYQDTGFNFLTLAFAHTAIFLDEPVYLYRTDNPFSSVHNCAKNPFILIDEYCYIRKRLQERPEIWEKHKAIFHEAIYGGNLWMYSRISPEQKSDFRQKLRGRLKEMQSYGYVTFSQKQQADMESFVEGGSLKPPVSPFDPKEIRFMGLSLAKRVRTDNEKIYTFLGMFRIRITYTPITVCYDSSLSYFRGRLASYRICGIPIGK